jgi:hypothetical protein
MKTLSNHTIIYDDECPMCDLYTGAFVKTGMLDKKGRAPFSGASDLLMQTVDKKRACNEIALVDNASGEVTYGIESLFRIIANSAPFLKPLFNQGWFSLAMQKLYSFISYNRKVIIPGKTYESGQVCTPSFNLTYRIAYIIMAWLVSSYILNHYSALLVPLVPASNFYREFMICGGQILFQAIIICILRKDRVIHYLGNMMTISLAGSLLLAIAIPLKMFINEPLFFAGYFMIVVGLMFMEHLRRIKLLGIHAFATASWVLYRLLVLSLIL